MAARKVDGLKYAREQLESREFQEGRSLIIDVYKTGSDEFSEGISRNIINVMRIMDFVAKIIDLGLVDKELLFYLFANNLYSLNAALINLEDRKKTNILPIKSLYPDGFSLFHEAAKASRKESREHFKRLNIYMTP